MANQWFNAEEKCNEPCKISLIDALSWKKSEVYKFFIKHGVIKNQNTVSEMWQHMHIKFKKNSDFMEKEIYEFRCQKSYVRNKKKKSKM